MFCGLARPEDKVKCGSCTLTIFYLFHELHGNIMRTSTARATRDYDHASLYCIPDRCS